MNFSLSRLSPSITSMIRMDHTHVLTVFHRYKLDAAPSKKQALVELACMALEIHAQLEEEIFYPAMRNVDADNKVLNKSEPEHDEMRRLIAALRGMQPTDSAYDETFMELIRDVMHHVADEETTLLPEAERLLADQVNTLGMEMTKRRLQLAAPKAGQIAMTTARGMPIASMMVAAGALMAGLFIYRQAMGASR